MNPETSPPCTCHHEKYRELIEESSDVIYEADALGFFTYVNDAVRKILGYTPEMLIGRPYTDLVPDHARESTVRHYRWQFDTRTPSTYFEFPVLTIDGGVVWFGQSVQTVIENGRVTGFRAIARDITERKNAEEEREAVEERFRNFMNNIPAVAFVRDEVGRFLFANESTHRTFGTARTSALNSESSRRHDREVLATGKAMQSIETMTMPDGQTRHWQTYKFPVPSSGGTRSIGCVTIDLTDRFALEAELAAARDTALASARQKSELLANMSHEIRTPMNGVLGLLGVLLDGELTPEQRELAETAHSSADSLLTIINDILDFSKIEAGKLTFELLEFDLRATVESVTDLMADAARKKGLDMGCVVDPELPRLLRGDPSRFRQVLLNLIGNAIKFTEQGGVLVQIDRESVSEQNVALRCRVTDSGIGIAAETQAKLFQPYMQADASTTRLFGGTGLGLAISQKLVQMMGGEIGVDSEPGCGSSFFFTAKFGRAAEGESSIETTPVRPRVLIVDDSATTRQIMALQLTAFGIPNDIADDSITALAMLRDAAWAGTPYDVILSDLNMPRANGLTFARIVKADASLGRPRFILITASAPRFDATALAELGVSACMTKPVRRHQLFQALLGNGPVETARKRAPEPVRQTAVTSRARVLVVDDSPVNQIVAVHQLEKLGYTADAVNNGVEALEALDRIPYDAVLMDCQMPEMDGYTATAELRRRERGTGRHIRVIALTASASPRDRQQCLDAGMDDFVTKPTHEKTLALALEGVGQRRTAA